MNSRSVNYYYIDVFTSQRFQGNPLAVFPWAQNLDDLTMQLIAREIGFSETVFVLLSTHPDCAVRLRIFTPNTELPFAGHPTLGAAMVLDHLGLMPGGEGLVEEGVGPIKVWKHEERWAMLQPSPKPGPIWERTDLLARLLGLAQAELDHRYDCQTWGSGLDFLYVPLISRQALSRARIQPAVLEEALSQVSLPPLYLLVDQDGVVHSRMFAPQLGVGEDSATGSAAGPLCAYLGASGLRETDSTGWIRTKIIQGEDMGRRSEIYAQARYYGQGWDQPTVSGSGVIVSQGVFFL